VPEKVQKSHKLLLINLCAFGIAGAAAVSRPRLPLYRLELAYQMRFTSPHSMFSKLSVDSQQLMMRLVFVILTLTFGVVLGIFKATRSPVSENETVKVFSGFPLTQRFPYAVKVFSRENQQTLAGFSCSGSIIHQLWIVTAAHCVYGFNVFDVFIGNVTNDLDHVVRAESAFIHPNYTFEPELSFDIALLKLKRSLETLNNSKLSLY
jgi:hypothetical protein